METPSRKDRRKKSRVSCRKPKSGTPPPTLKGSVSELVQLYQQEKPLKSHNSQIKENGLPSTQAFQPTCTSSSLKDGGEVYWDSNSPSLKTKILRHYSECSSPDVRKSLSPQIVSTPLTRVCTLQESPKIDEQDLSLLQSLKALNDFDRDDSNTDNEESKESKENTFNSDEDSFLVQASQVIQQPSETSCQKSTRKIKTQSSLKPLSLPRLPPPAFNEDDDDEMDLLLSQIEMPKEVEDGVLNIKSVRRHEPVTAAGHNEEKFLKRRFKSSEQGPKSSSSSSSANIMKGWRRSNTEPETSSGSALPGGRILPPAKCTKEDIEKKRQEALRRRKEKLQGQR